MHVKHFIQVRHKNNIAGNLQFCCHHLVLFRCYSVKISILPTVSDICFSSVLAALQESKATSVMVLPTFASYFFMLVLRVWDVALSKEVGKWVAPIPTWVIPNERKITIDLTQGGVHLKFQFFPYVCVTFQLFSSSYMYILVSVRLVEADNLD